MSQLRCFRTVPDRFTIADRVERQWAEGERRPKKDPNADEALPLHSYNRYLAISARVVRRSLKEEPRLAAERRGQQDLRFSKWEVSRRPDWEWPPEAGRREQAPADQGFAT